MSLKETLRTKMNEARKGKNQLQLDLLSVILGAVSTQESGGKELTDEAVESIIRKTQQGNYVSLATVALGEATKEEINEAARKIGDGDSNLLKIVREKNHAAYERAANEDSFFTTLLPKTLTVSQIRQALEGVVADLKAAKNEGAAMGVAMKTVKSLNLKVLGDDVKKAVAELRAS